MNKLAKFISCFKFKKQNKKQINPQESWVDVREISKSSKIAKSSRSIQSSSAYEATSVKIAIPDKTSPNESSKCFKFKDVGNHQDVISSSNDSEKTGMNSIVNQSAAAATTSAELELRTQNKYLRTQIEYLISSSKDSEKKPDVDGINTSK